MAIQNAHHSSIYVTFKVFHLINQLRRRLRPRVSSDRTKTDSLGPVARLRLEEDAFREVEKCLPLPPRVSGLESRKYRNAHDRVRKSKKGNRSFLKHLPLGNDASAPPNTSKEQVQRILRDLDGQLTAPKNALSKIAASNKLFIERNTELKFDHLSLREVTQCLALVHEAINALHHARTQYGDKWVICQGNEIGLCMDENFIANYEHLLYCLRGQLIQTFIRKAIEWLEADARQGYGKKQRNLLSWFSEFPDNHRPLSTTWPWSIKPSLAVLWGVCWMFFYPPSDNNDLGDYGNVGVSQNIFFQDEEAAQWIGWGSHSPQPNEYLQFGRELVAPSPSQPQQNANNNAQQPRRTSGDVGSMGARQNVGRPQLPRNNLSEAHHVPLPALSARAGVEAPAQPQFFRSSQATRLQDCLHPSQHDPIGNQGYLVFSGPTSQSDQHQYNNYALTSHASAETVSAQFSSWPENQGIATQRDLGSQLPTNVEGLDGLWSIQQHTQRSPVTTKLPQQRHGNTGHLTIPNIRLTTDGQAPDTEGIGLTAPQSTFYSNTYAPAPSTPQALRRNPLNNRIRVDTNVHNINSMGNFGPEISPIHQQIMTPHTPGNPNIPSPISIMSDKISPAYERRPSNSSSHREPRDSEDRSSVEAADSGLSPRRGHTYKRSEEPRRNLQNKMICRYKECANLTFDRKCEWSKHMDKHDRPYKCNVAGCEKLQGFTYSGGLLRHEREVHKMHGGTKKSLFCPHPDCKRSSGSGFTRKENLAEHVRRVHRRTSGSSDMGNAIMKLEDEKDEQAEYLQDAEDEETNRDDGQNMLRKRKRSSIAEELLDNGDLGVGDEGGLRAEVKRLRRENEEKDERLRQLEAAVRRLQQAER